jgi:hypothetical protein
MTTDRKASELILKRVQGIARELKKPGQSVVDEFLAERLEEQRRSDERFDRLEREAAKISNGRER